MYHDAEQDGKADHGAGGRRTPPQRLHGEQGEDDGDETPGAEPSEEGHRHRAEPYPDQRERDRQHAHHGEAEDRVRGDPPGEVVDGDRHDQGSEEQPHHHGQRGATLLDVGRLPLGPSSAGVTEAQPTDERGHEPVSVDDQRRDVREQSQRQHRRPAELFADPAAPAGQAEHRAAGAADDQARQNTEGEQTRGRAESGGGGFGDLRGGGGAT